MFVHLPLRRNKEKLQPQPAIMGFSVQCPRIINEKKALAFDVHFKPFTELLCLYRYLLSSINSNRVPLVWAGSIEADLSLRVQVPTCGSCSNSPLT